MTSSIGQIVAFRSEAGQSDHDESSPVLPDFQYPQGLEELIRDVMVLGCQEYPLHKFFRVFAHLPMLYALKNEECLLHTQEMSMDEART